MSSKKQQSQIDMKGFITTSMHLFYRCFFYVTVKTVTQIIRWGEGQITSEHFPRPIYKISFNHPCVCRIELSNPSCLTVFYKRGFAEFTNTVGQRGLENSLRQIQGD